jgi:hypothetical protein
MDWVDMIARLRYVYRLQEWITFERLYPNMKNDQELFWKIVNNVTYNVPGFTVGPMLATL